MRHILEELPEALDETYERVLRGINKANRHHAHRLLQCLTVAIRPLRVEELAEVLAVDFTSAHGDTPKVNVDWRWEDQQNAVLFTCSNLISIVDDDGSRVVQFSHFLVKEFLTSPRLATSSADVSRYHILLAPAHTTLAQTCLGVLLQLHEGFDKDSVDGASPLAPYAAQHWVDHTQSENVASCLFLAMEHLFDPDRHHFVVWCRLHDIDSRPVPGPTFLLFALYANPEALPLYYAARCGFYNLVEHLTKYGQQVNAYDGYYKTPLVVALAGEHFRVARLLLRNGAAVDFRGDGEQTPLHLAAYYGHVEMVRILLEYKSDVNSRDFMGRTPLYNASDEDDLKPANALQCANVVRLLLEHGADVNVRAEDGLTPLYGASRWGTLEVARLLLEHGANVYAEDDYGTTPLQVASEMHHDAIMKLMLDHSAK